MVEKEKVETMAHELGVELTPGEIHAIAIMATGQQGIISMIIEKDDPWQFSWGWMPSEWVEDGNGGWRPSDSL